MTRTAKQKKLVLLGGGHAQVFLLESLARQPQTNTSVTLITKDVAAPYSGMLPGYVAGHYSHKSCHIDLKQLADRASARLIHAPAFAIDRNRKVVEVEGHEPVPYDVLSINIGITPDTDDIKGAREHALVVKPVSDFSPKWDAFLRNCETQPGEISLAIVGGGAAGFELATAAQHSLKKITRSQNAPDHALKITLVTGKSLLASHNPRTQALAKQALEARGITLIENDIAEKITPKHLHLASGRTISATRVMVATRAAAARWFANSDMPLTADGFLKISATLQLTDDENVFATGDCATNIDFPRPKAGVFAVRQGPILAKNVRNHLAGNQTIAFEPQEDFLTILSLGDKSAIAARGKFAIQGWWVWYWKDWIDRAFMNRFNR